MRTLVRPGGATSVLRRPAETAADVAGAVRALLGVGRPSVRRGGRPSLLLSSSSPWGRPRRSASGRSRSPCLLPLCFSVSSRSLSPLWPMVRAENDAALLGASCSAVTNEESSDKPAKSCDEAAMSGRLD